MILEQRVRRDIAVRVKLGLATILLTSRPTSRPRTESPARQPSIPDGIVDRSSDQPSSEYLPRRDGRLSWPEELLAASHTRACTVFDDSANFSRINVVCKATARPKDE